MKVLRESYTLNEIQDRITDTRNILSALRDSLYVLSSALENPDEQREEYEDLAYNVDKYYIGDVESMIGDFERDSRGIEGLEESLHEDVFKEWKPDLRFKHIQSILDAAIKRGKYANNEREEVMAALDRADKGGYTPEQRKFIKDKHAEMWRKNKRVSESFSLKEEYIDSDLAEKTQRKSIKNLYDRNELSIVKRGNFWYTEDCPVKYFQIVKKEMKKYFPELTYLYDAEPYKSNVGKSISKKLQNEPVNEDTIKTKEGINAIKKEAFELLDDLGGYTDYTGRIEAVADEFDLSFDEAEELVDEWIQTADEEFEESLKEDTIKTKDGKWVNKGDTGETHGEFKTKKEADAQRKAIFASGWKK